MTSSPAATALAADLELALRLADAADAETLPRCDAADLTITTKPDNTHVSDADLAAERAIRTLLETERPDDGIFGEEFGQTGTSSRQWIIDPIDGTAHFLRGIPLWGTMIALAIDGVPQLGVVSMPALGRRWWGTLDGGAWTNGPAGPTGIRVSAIDNLGEATASFQSITQWMDAGEHDALHRLADAVWRDRAYGDVYAYMMLAEGRLEVVAEFDVKEYDIAAAWAIVSAAGGRFTAYSGSDSISERSALATNGILHDTVSNLVHGSS